MVKPDISKFSLNIIAPHMKARLNEEFPGGDAFQQLCFDLLSREYRKREKPVRLALYPTERRDGAVDISGEDADGGIYLFECKKNINSKAAKKSLHVLSDKLKKKLKKTRVKQNLYHVWYNTRVTTYVYCVSCGFDSLAERITFKNDVAQMLEELSTIDGLSHLETAARNIELFTWDELRVLLEDNTFLYHKWIKQDFALGFTLLRKRLQKDGGASYAGYLVSDKLEYYSRDAYKANHTDAEGLPGETDILESLFNAHYDGAIFYGDGGIGKTRLMLELGLMAEKEKWGEWTVYCIDTHLSVLESLAEFLTPGTKYLLLFDYIEDIAFFDEKIVARLRELCPGSDFKVIGNCRKTHYDYSSLADAENFRKWYLSSRVKAEKEYKLEVVERILGDLQNLFDVGRDFYELRPAFAVFLRYLNEKGAATPTVKDKIKDYPDFVRDLRELPSFRGWIKKQLCKSFKANDNIRHSDDWRQRLYLFFALPVMGLAAQNLHRDFQDITSPLLKDGWFEWGADNDFRVIHDTIAEEILILWLAMDAMSLGLEFERIIEFTAGRGVIANGFRIFERISDWIRESAGFQNYSGIFYDTFSRLIDESPEFFTDKKLMLVNTPLLDETDSLLLIKEKEPFFRDLIGRELFGMTLYSKMKYFYKNREKYTAESLDGVKTRLEELLADWTSINRNFQQTPYISARVISAFMLLFGFDKKFPGEDEEVWRFACRWLEDFNHTKQAEFVIKSWLDAGGDKERIEEFVKQWLEEFPLVVETGFVLTSWLRAGGDIVLIKEYIIPWLNQFPLDEENTSFVLKSWLDAGGAKECIEEFVVQWLKEYKLTKETSFVIESWLDAGGAKECIEEFVVQWLKEFPRVLETSFVLKSWLDAGGAKECIEEFVVQWLTEFKRTKETRFVLISWLDAGGAKECIEEFVVQWLEKFKHLSEASFVLRKWIKKTGDITLIDTFAQDWLLAFRDHPKADFVVNPYCRCKQALLPEILDVVIYWCRKYASRDYSLFTVAALTEYHMDENAVAAPWLTDYLSKWLDNPSLSSKDIVNLNEIMQNISTNQEFSNSPNVRALSQKWAALQ